jgi:DNA invertase Pin-like site-specific DNA recombinase
MRTQHKHRSEECVVIYARVSTEEQAKGGAGIAAQVAECSAYADRQGWTVAEVVIEDAVSGKIEPARRPQFPRALALVADCGGTLLVRRGDRVSRNGAHMRAMVDTAARDGWVITTTDGKIDTSTAAGRLRANAEAMVSEYERDVIVERTVEALASLKASGVRLGRPSDLDPRTAARAAELLAGGASLRTAGATLTEEGHRTAFGGPWHPAQVKRAAQTHALNAYSEERAALL